MGNCSLKSVVVEKSQLSSIRIVMDSGKILELEGPKLVHEVVSDFPGYGVFKKRSRALSLSLPLADQEKLLSRRIYYLLPLGELQKKVVQQTNDQLKSLCSEMGLDEVKKVESTDDWIKDICAKKRLNEVKVVEKVRISKDDHLNDLSAKVSVSLNEAEPVRMSSAASDIVMSLANGSGLEVLPPPQKGIWRVKLVITTKQLEEIFSEEVNTEALIEQMRMAAASGHVTPRRAKSYFGLMLKPILCNVFRAANDDERNDVEPMELCISSPIKV